MESACNCHQGLSGMENPTIVRLKNFGESKLRFRHKVLLGVSLSLIAGIFTGANAIYNVRQVGNSVNFSAEAASPLLIGVISLSESYQKLQSVFDPVMKNCAGLEAAARYLEVSQDNQRRKLAGLQGYARQAHAASELGRYEFSGQKIFKTRKALLDVCHKYTSTLGEISIADGALRNAASAIGIDASKNVLELEGQFDNIWRGQPDPSLVLPEIPSLQAATDQWEMQRVWNWLRDFYRVKIYVSEIGAANTVVGGVSKRFDLERKLKTYRARLSAMETTIADLRPYYAERGRLNDFQALLALAYQTRMMLHGAVTSLFSSYMDLLDNDKEKQNLVFRLQREQGQYSVALLNIMDVAQRINRNAQLETEHNAMVASWEIAAGVFGAAILAFFIGWYFKLEVTKPLEMLTSNLSDFDLALRADGALVDDRLLLRHDEIGDLAKQFAQTFEALANARQQLQEASRAEIAVQHDRLHGAIENMPQGLYMLDGSGHIVVANRQLSVIYNLADTIGLEGMTADGFMAHCRDKGAGVRRTISDEIVTTPGTEGARPTSQRVVQLDDGRYMTITVIPLVDGGHVVTHEDVTEKQTASEKITHMALHDGLTGLANRTLFRNHLAWETSVGGHRGSAALLFLDLDRFKIVNDTLGHPIGDALLVEVAQRLKQSLGPGCFAARLGGDEFAVFQTDVSLPNDAQALATKIIKRISDPFEIEGHHIVIGTSIGIAAVPPEIGDADELLKNADLALYCAKQAGRGQFRFFEPDMDRKMRDWHEMEHDLRDAIHCRQFELYFQPMVALENETIVGFEALVRWHHPRRGFVSPADFIPVAEEAGLINEIGAWILESACQTAMQWPSEIVVAVNISPVQFGSRALPLTVAAALSKSGLSPERLMLEITEGVFLNDSDQTMNVLNEIKRLGVNFAMDDFGTGYSSLSYIRKFQFDKIKIDQSFVRGIASNAESIAIVRAVTNLCRDLGMVTTAEGVETEEQAAILKGLGCVLAQGYYFGRPTPAPQALALFSKPARASA
jgi:diguanylate cyclase (GGDEF)-like protein